MDRWINSHTTLEDYLKMTFRESDNHKTCVRIILLFSQVSIWKSLRLDREWQMENRWRRNTKRHDRGSAGVVHV